MKIIGTGSALPKQRITNDDLAKVMDTSDEWIRSRTGIGARHLVNPEENTTSLAVEASKRALESANLNPEDLDLIIAESKDQELIDFTKTTKADWLQED